MGIGIWQLVIVLVIVLLLFGTKKLRNVGGDLGGAIKNFKKSVKESEDDQKQASIAKKDEDGNIIEGEVTQEEKDKNA